MKTLLTQMALAVAFLASGVVSRPKPIGRDMSPVPVDPFSSSTGITIATTLSLEAPVQGTRRPQAWYTEPTKHDAIGAHPISRTVASTAVKSAFGATNLATITMTMAMPTSDGDYDEDYEIEEYENDSQTVDIEKRNAKSFGKYKDKHKKKYSRIADRWASASQKVVDRRKQKKINESLEAEELKTMDPKKAEKKRAKISKAIAASISHSMAWERVRTTKEPMWTSALALAATTTILSPKDIKKAAKKAAKQAEKARKAGLKVGLTAPTTATTSSIITSTSTGTVTVQTTTASAAPQAAVAKSSSSTRSIVRSTITVFVDVTQPAAPKATPGTPIKDIQAKDDEIFSRKTVSDQEEKDAQRIRMKYLLAHVCQYAVHTSKNAAKSVSILAM